MTKLGECEGGSESEIGIGNGNARDGNVTVYTAYVVASEHNIHAVYLIGTHHLMGSTQRLKSTLQCLKQQ